MSNNIEIFEFQFLSTCSHEPGAVNCPGVMVGHWQVLPCVHIIISWGKLSILWWLRIDLNSFSFDTSCYIEWILGTVTYLWYFLDLFTLKFILNINNKHEQVYTIPRTTFSFCSYGAKLPWQGWLPGVVQRVTRLSKLPKRNEKLMWTVTGVRPRTKAKFSLGSVSCPEIMWIGSNSLWLSAGCNTLSRSPVKNVAVDKWKVLGQPGLLKAVFYFKVSLLLWE